MRELKILLRVKKKELKRKLRKSGVTGRTGTRNVKMKEQILLLCYKRLKLNFETQKLK